MAFTRSLPDLGRIISNQAKSIHDALNAAGVDQPSFEYGAEHYGGPYSRAMEDSRAQLLEALDEMRSLIVGPAGHVFFMSFMGVSTLPGNPTAMGRKSSRLKILLACMDGNTQRVVQI